MFCSNCGTELPEESKVCFTCGTPVDADVSTVAAAEPVQEVAVQNEPQPQKSGGVLSKSKYISQIAPKKVKIFSIIALVLTVVMIISMVFSTHSAVSTSLEETPIGSTAFMLAGVDVDDFKEVKDEIGDGADELENMLKEDEDELDDDEVEFVEDVVEDIEDCADALSIKNIHYLIKNVMKIQEFDNFSEEDVEDVLGGSANTAINIVYSIYYVVLGCFAFAFIFSVFGGFFKRTGLIVTGMIFGILFSSIFSGLIATLFVALVHALLIGFTVAVNGSYKDYKRGF